MNQLPHDFPPITPCWFCKKNIQDHSGAWQTKQTNTVVEDSVRIACYRHLPDNEIIYRWIKENDEWILTAIIFNYKDFIVHAVIKAPNTSHFFKDGVCTLFERRKNGEVANLMDLPLYWILQSSIDKVNQKIKTYSVIL